MILRSNAPTRLGSWFRKTQHRQTQICTAHVNHHSFNTLPPTASHARQSRSLTNHLGYRSDLNRSRTRCLSFVKSNLTSPTQPIPTYSSIFKRSLTYNGKHRKEIETNTFNNTLTSLREVYAYVRTHLSLDIWTLNVILITFIIGPYVWNSIKASTLSEDDYMIPVDDPVEHSVRILLDSMRKDAEQDNNMQSSSTSNVIIKSPEEDAKRILNDLLDSENLRTTASRIASGVIQMEPFQNACKQLVRNIWDDLINDKETTAQLTTLVTTVLENEKIYSAVKALLLQLVNDEEVYRELTTLVVKLGEEQEVLAATQQLLTKSAHRTMNDPNILDHSMEFAAEVVGDDVVQRTGGDALWNTVGYAVQPSGNAVLVGTGTLLVAGILHLYLSRGTEGVGKI
ncbi:hypothetical protein ACHAXH_008778 [Discostella pseudostelligera]